MLVTVRYHDHTRVLRLPGFLARPLRERIEVLNTIYDEVHEAYGALRLDLGDVPAIYDRDMWAMERLHPSEKGHHLIAREVGALFRAEGLEFPLPPVPTTTHRPGPRAAARTVLCGVAPWLARRARDLAPGTARAVVRRGRVRLKVDA
jgi:hypothetical protein